MSEQSLILLVGNIGSGKSFLANRLAKRGAIVVNHDNIIRLSCGGDYKYDPDKREIYHAVEDTMIRVALNKGYSIVIDRTNIDKKSRKRFIEIGKEFLIPITVYNFGPGTKEQLQRRLADAQGQTEETWNSVHKNIFDRYEEPDHEEGIDYIYPAKTHFRFYAFDFDGTIVENKFPFIGEPKQDTINEINKLSQSLDNIIIIWSCRSGDFENQMKQWLDKNEVYYDFINENPIFNIGTRKIFCHYYIDDRNRCFNENGGCSCTKLEHNPIDFDKAVKETNAKLVEDFNGS